MLLRSSSAPIAQSVFVESHHRPIETNTKISFSHSIKQLGGGAFFKNRSPSSSCLPELSQRVVKFRRASSDSNLESLDFDPSSIFRGNSSSGCLNKGDKEMLRTEPSFCIYNEEEEVENLGRGKDNEDLINERLVEVKLERSATIGSNIETQFSFGKNSMQAIEEVDGEIEEDDSGELDKHYEKLIGENTTNPLVLRNYALHLESKKDYIGAEEYYLRAMKADPKDGEVMSRYAKLLYEIHCDRDKASSYFKKATQIAPEDSYVLAAYASFLWDIDEDEDEDEEEEEEEEENDLLDSEAKYIADEKVTTINDYEEEVEERPVSPRMHLAMGLGIGMIGLDHEYDTASKERSTVEEHFRWAMEENPCDSLALRNYAHFLHECKGDLHRADEYYSRSILLDPHDGVTLSLYADVVWQLHHDKDRTLSYFERAVQASPSDSNVLASYAKFLWEIEDESEDGDAKVGVLEQIPVSN